MERLRNTLAKKVEEVHDPKVRVQGVGFEARHGKGEILAWSTDLETEKSSSENLLMIFT